MAASIVQQKFDVSQGGTSQATIAITPNSSLTVGNYLWVVCWGSATMAAASIADTASNSWTARTDTGYSSCWVRAWTAPITTGGTPTITVTPPANRNMSIMLVEVSGVNSGTPVELSGSVWQLWDNSSFPASPLNFGATTNADQLILAAAGTGPGIGSSRDYGANTGWTQVAEATSGPTICLISKSVTSTGTYDPDFTMAAAGSTQVVFVGISFVSAAGGGTVDVAGAATAGASASATLAVQRNLAATAVANALASGSLSLNKALTGAAIGQAVGSAALAVFSQVWRIPTNAANGSAVHALIFTGAAPNYTVLAQGNATVAGGFVDVPGSGVAGTKAFAFVHNYNDNTATTSIRGGPAIATLTSI